MAYCDLLDVKRYKGISSSDDDTLLEEFILDAQTIIDEETRRIFEASSDTTRTFDAERDVSDDGITLFLDEDLSQITTVTNGDSVVVASTEYTTEPRNRTPYFALKLLQSSGKVWTFSTDAEDSISIEGRWSYSVTAPQDIKRACIILATWGYNRKDGVGKEFDGSIVSPSGMIFRSSGLPDEVARILNRYKIRV
jgi:hypothetical protein